jgi:Flp pilus assembly protein TadB
VIDDPLFIRIIVGGFLLQVFGILIMRRMINFRI